MRLLLTIGASQAHRVVCDAVRSRPYRRAAMQEGRWTTRPCDWSRVAALAEELGVSEPTAPVLVRRGLDEPEAARGFLASEPPAHDPHTLGDMAVAVERIRAAGAAGGGRVRPRAVRVSRE